MASLQGRRPLRQIGYAPEDDRGVLAGGGEPAAIRFRADRHGKNISGVALERSQLVPGGDVPDLDGLARRRDQALAIRCERREIREAIITHRKAAQRLLGLSRALGIPGPELDRPVIARRREQLAVGAELQAPHVLDMPADDADYLGR